MLLAGFKSYAGSVEVRGLEDFTCIIGANGAGKSVMVRPPVLQKTHAEVLLPSNAQACTVILQGDAIAFVLGSASGMRRTQLMKLVNDNLKQGSASNCEAQAVVHPFQNLATCVNQSWRLNSASS